MKTEDQNWTVVLMPDFYSIETTAYETWQDFSMRLDELIHAVIDVLEPRLEERVGLRFIDRITHPDVTRPSDWRGLVEDSFLGVLSDDQLTTQVDGTQQVIQLKFDSGISTVLRHGCAREQAPGGGWVYVLDADCYVQRGRAHEPERLLVTLEDLHTLAVQLFQSAVSDRLFAYLKG